MSEARAVPVAFVVPSYQSEETITGCLNSILAQTFSNIEVLVIDDGSTDRSADIVEEFAQRDKRVRLVRSPINRGVAHTLNVGLSETDATFIARLDADDEAHPARVEKQLEFMSSAPDVAVCGSFVTYIGASAAYDQVREVPVRNDQIQDVLKGSVSCPFYHPSVMFRRSMVTEIGGYREFFHNSEDYDLWLRLSRAHEFFNIPTPLTRYRLSTNGASLPRLREQRLYALVAKHAVTMPQRELSELWTELATDTNKAETTAYVLKEYRHYAAELADLGRLREALNMLLEARGDVGHLAILRFAASRLKRRLAAPWPLRE